MLLFKGFEYQNDTNVKCEIRCELCLKFIKFLRWTDTGSRTMTAILFLINYQNVQKWFKIN